MKLNAYRIAAALLGTIMLLPCMGFSVFGALASREFPDEPVWMWIYIGLELFLLAMLTLLWRWALRRVVPPNGCSTCGYDLSGRRAERCPECGASV